MYINSLEKCNIYYAYLNLGCINSDKFWLLQTCRCTKVKKKLSMAAFSYLTSTSPGHWATLGKLFHSQFCVQPTYGAKEYRTRTNSSLG